MKKCKYCGKEFKTGYKGRKFFCSDKCGQIWWRKKYQKKYKKKRKRNTPCVVCGNILPKYKKSYCSDLCEKQARDDRYKKYSSNLFIDVCLNCTKDDCDGICDLLLKEGAE